MSRTARNVRFYLISLFLFPILLSLFIACGRKEPVKIGFAGNLSGRGADLGISGRNGALLAVEAKNRSGGIHGRDIRLVVKDDRQDPATALEADRALIELGVEAIIGHMTSAMSKAVVPLVNESGIVMVSPTTTTTLLAGLDDSFLRVSSSTREYAGGVARHLFERRGFDTAALLLDFGNKAYSESWHGEFKAAYEALGGKITGVETFVSGPEVHFYEVMKKMISFEADVLVFVTNAMDSAMFAQQVRKEGNTVPIATSAWASTEKLLDMGGAAVEGVIVSQFFNREDESVPYRAFRDEYRKRFNEEPGFASVNAYDAANVILEALEARGDGESLKETILRVGKFQGIQAPVQFDVHGDAMRESLISTVVDGRFRVLE